MKKRKFNLKKEYKEAWNYLEESRKFIYIIIAIFFIFVLIGFFIPTPEFVFNYIVKFIEELMEKTQGMSQGQLISFIFFNNLQSSFFGIFFGILLGIFPVIITIVNGYLLGFVSLITIEAKGSLVLLRILPHGIFELPAVFISLGLGLKLGTFIFKKKKIVFLKQYFWNSMRVFLLFVIPLLLIAGIIEGSLIFLLG